MIYAERLEFLGRSAESFMVHIKDGYARGIFVEGEVIIEHHICKKSSLFKIVEMLIKKYKSGVVFFVV